MLWVLSAIFKIKIKKIKVIKWKIIWKYIDMNICGLLLYWAVYITTFYLYFIKLPLYVYSFTSYFILLTYYKYTNSFTVPSSRCLYYFFLCLLPPCIFIIVNMIPIPIHTVFTHVKHAIHISSQFPINFRAVILLLLNGNYGTGKRSNQRNMVFIWSQQCEAERKVLILI